MSASIPLQLVFSVGVFLLAGYLFAHASYMRRFRLAHLPAHQQTFHILAYALVLYIASWFACEFIIGDKPPGWLASFEAGTELRAIALIALFIAGVATRPESKHPLHQDIAELQLSTSTVAIDMNDLGFVVPWSQICSMTIFNEHIYEATNVVTTPGHGNPPVANAAT
jgi:hypothetical protein